MSEPDYESHWESEARSHLVVMHEKSQLRAMRYTDKRLLACDTVLNANEKLLGGHIIRDDWIVVVVCKSSRWRSARRSLASKHSLMTMAQPLFIVGPWLVANRQASPDIITPQ
jgi:hypothetical protein